MKRIYQKLSTLLLALGLAFTLTSCYTTTTAVGKLDKDSPMVKVNSIKNHFLICGLIPVSNGKVQDTKYVGDAKNYQVKKSITFVDGLLNFITFGIYTPSTTTYYMPLDKENR